MEFIIVALILLILLIMFKRAERFDDVGPYNADCPVKIFRTDNLNGLMIDTRQPGLMEQRYSYDDKNLCYTPVIPGVARLQLRNWYSAKAPCDSKRLGYPYQISGYDPNIFLPAEQADRSKISIEKYMAAGYWNMK